MRIMISLGLALALAACGGSESKRDGSDDRSAEGEVLGGAISDEMLPLESVQSQSPQMKVAPVAAAADPAEEADADAETISAPVEPAQADESTE